MQQTNHSERREELTARRIVTVGRPPEEIYRFWHDFGNLTFMKHLESVTQQDETHSHWVALGPGGLSIEWDAVITRDEANERIDWETTKDTGMIGAGTVRFRPAPGGRGTELDVTLTYRPPGGKLAAAFSTLLGGNPSQMLREDLRRFKQQIETGEIPTIDGQPAG